MMGEKVCSATNVSKRLKGREVVRWRVKDRDLHSVGEVEVYIRERYSDLSGVSIDLSVLDNIGIGMDDSLSFLSQFNIDVQSLDILIARKIGRGDEYD
jgi:hypothetical protein